MRWGMMRAAFMAVMGCGMIWFLADPSVTGYRAFAAIMLAGLFIGLSVAEAFLAYIYGLIDLMEAGHKKSFERMFEARTTILYAETGLSWKRLEFPIAENQLKDVARACLNGAPFSENYWVKQSHILKSTEFRQTQDEFAKRGYVQLRVPGEPRQGYVFTRAGEAFLRYVTTSPLKLVPPSPALKIPEIVQN